MLLKDRISELPPEILVDILSLLETKEAGRTSILARRWRYTWTQISNLCFDGGEVLHELDKKTKRLKVERGKYINHVNQVIRCHQGQTIEQFVAVFDLHKRSGSDIDNWVSFAMRKNVRRLKLDLRSFRILSRTNQYSFPEISRCRSLTSLHLDEVDITGEMLELLLYNCLDLESVFVRCSWTLISLNVDGPPSLKLKCLEVDLCHNIKSLNVSAPNLVSFKYNGLMIPMPLKDVPKLLELSITGPYSYSLNNHLSELSSYLSGLVKLTLGAGCLNERHMRGAKFPVMPQLKHLTLTVNYLGFDSFVDCASLINACPSLYKFSFETQFCFWLEKHEFKAEAAYPPHSNIRVVEFNAFRGLAFETGLAMYLIKNAVMLKKITFDAVNPWCKEESPEPESQALARARAREVGKTVPPGVELLIT